MNVANWMKITKYIIPRFGGAAQNSEPQITHNSDHQSGNIEVGEDVVIECGSNHPVVINIESQAPQNLDVGSVENSDNSSSVEVSMTSSLTADGNDRESQMAGDSSAMDVRNNSSISIDNVNKETQPSGTLSAIDAGDVSSVSEIDQPSTISDGNLGKDVLGHETQPSGTLSAIDAAGDVSSVSDIDQTSTISDGNLSKDGPGNDSDDNTNKVEVVSGWKNFKVDKSGLIDLIFAIVGLLLVLTIFLIAQRTHVPPTIETNKPNRFTQTLLNGLKLIQSGPERLYAYVGSANTGQFMEPILTGINELKQLYQSIGTAQFSALVQPFSNGVNLIQNEVKGLYTYAIGSITPPPKTLWNHMTDMLSYVTVKKEQPRGYGIENTFFYMWQPEPPKTTTIEDLMFYGLCNVVLLATFLVVRQPLASLLENFDYGYLRKILSKGKWFLPIGVMAGFVASVIYSNTADMISSSLNLVTYTGNLMYKEPDPEPTLYQHFCAALMVSAMLFVFIIISSVVIFQMHYISDGVYDFSRRKVLTSAFIILTTIAIGVCGIAGYESFGKMNSSDNFTFVYLLTLIFFTLIV
ncbi:uncharacterized protein [Clytia hemisphaerica]|uniref:Uncharacterized protein n=1 Tax=Clytia hemisphaerica TaxID=252671 RepID=A0A7M5XAR6_9CNID